MFIAPISFKANFNLKVGDSSGIEKEHMENEINFAKKAREYGVSVPIYEQKSPYSIQYTTNGEMADYNTNKITPEHLKSLFKNLYIMDITNISHNDLDIGHVFYSDNGKVEFDCFRFASQFIVDDKKQYNLPDFIMPTNQINYENASLGFYVEQIPTEREKIDFAKQYLQESYYYHKNRANCAYENLGKYSKEMYTYELVKTDVLRNPDDKMAKLLLYKLEFLTQQRKAFTEWDEGNCACGHSFDRDKRINAIPMYLEAVKMAINYSKKAEYLAKKESGSKSEYYKYEAEFGKFFANLYLSWVQGMADYNFTDIRVCPLEENEVTELSNNYQKIIDSEFDSKKSKIDEYLKLYNSKTY